jgi:hypothetical protein
MRQRGRGGHPGAELLTAYHAGELTPAEEDDLQEHVATCRHCSQLLLDLPSFLEPPATGDQGHATLAEASWQEIRKYLAVPMREPPDRRPRAFARRVRVPRSLQLLAAALALALIATPLWLVARRLASPGLPPAVALLDPVEVYRGNPEPTTPTIVHADSAATVLVLHLARELPDLRFRAELQSGSTPSTPLRGVTTVDARTLLIVLTRRQFAPGRYQIHVLDLDHREEGPLGDFQFEVVEP